jgi:stearoyl-CoA desaturase (Delta-9 desaturase)
MKTEASLFNKIKTYLNHLDWVNTLFLALSPVIALVGTTYLIWTNGIHWETAILAFVMALITGIAVTAGYHRLFSHRSYEANPMFKLVMLLFGAAAFENSARRWASDHRNHHKFVDTDLDPYNIKRGFFYAHMGWVCLKYDNAHRYDNVPDLDVDKLVRFQERHYISLGILVGFVLPTAIAALWGDPLGGFILAGFLRLVLNHHFTFSINSFCHMLGSQPYSDKNTARDSWFLALFTYGEGYHNFHHKFPSDYRNGIKAYHWDPTKWLIKCMSWFGTTHSLRQISEQKIMLSRLRMDEKRLVRRMIKTTPVDRPIISPELVATTRLKFEEAYVRFLSIKKEYGILKDQKLTELNVQMAHFNERIAQLKKELHEARLALQEAMVEWRNLCQRFGVRPNLSAI